MLLSVAPGPAKGLDDELFLPTGGYVDESQFLPTGGYVDESQFLPTGSCDVFSGDAETQTARFDFAFEGAPTIEQFADGVLVTLDGEETWLAVGDPVVPVHQSSFVLPEGMAITSVEITYLDTGVVIGSGMQLLAAPTAVALDGSLPTGDEWTEVVSTSFPDAEAASFSNYSMAGYQIGSLRVFPVEYDATTDTLTYHSEVSVNVTVSAVATDGTVDVRDVEGDRDRVARLVDNPDALDFYTVTTTGDPSDPAAPGDAEPAITALPGGNYEYVVITSAALADTFQDLVDQKTSRGLSAGIVTTEYVSANYTGTENGDLADKIRHFISDAYANWGTEWVLLGGDTEIIPVRGVYAAVGSTVDNALPTDMYYACLDGTWNGDGDGLWGEANDGTGGGDIDLAPEVYIGRAPVSNATEAFNFVAKTVRYETTTHANVDTAVWLGESLDASTFGSYSGIPIRDQSLPDDWNVVEMYDSAGGWTAGDLLNQLNASPNIVNHLGHANETYNARLYNSNVAALSNEDPFFMYSQGCMSGSLDTHNISIAEQYVVDDHGAFGVVMNSRYGWYMPGTTPSASHYYANEFWDAVFNEGLTSLGQANQDSKDDNMFRVGTTGSYRWITFETNLFGDPETAIQTATGPVAPPTGVEGTVWNDTNGNGVMDGEEQGLAGQRVYLDANGNGQYDNDSQTVVSGQVPVTIIDNEAVTSALVIDGGPQSIYDLNVTLNITHTYDSDLEIYLISPNATRVMLVNRAGGGGDNFTNTTLDDEADTHISTATAPFTGTYRAAELLSAFDGEDANGTWTLEIWDRATYDSGELTGWSMELCGSMPETSVATDAQGEFSFSDLAAGSYSIGHELSGGWSHTQPGSGILNVDVGEGVVVGNVDFGVREETLPPAVDLGTIDFLEIAGLDPTGGDLWYTLETSHQGYLTLEALFAGSGDQLEMALHDVNFNVLANSTVSTGGERIDWQATVGQTFYLSVQGTVAEVDLRLANLVSRNGTELTIHGTDGDDEFRLAAGTTHQVTINGVDYAFSGTEVTAVAFAGGAGSDAAVLVASAGADTARAWPTSATLTGGSYSVSVTQVSDISLVGNGDNDVAFLYDSAGDDTLVVNDAYARMSGGLPGEAFSAQADNFRYVHGYSRAGGTDTAELYGTVGNDTVVTRQTDAKIMGAEHFGRAWYFDAVTVQGGGGNDLAVLFDSAGQDILRASPTNTTFSGNLFDYQILGVRSVRAYSSGGNDVAFLYDSAGDDTLVVDDTHGSLTGGLPGEAFALTANNFRYVHGYSTAGGTDTAELYGTAGNDTVVTRQADAKIAGAGHFGRAWYFGDVTIQGGGGDDLAVLYDSAAQDILWASPTNTTFSSSGLFAYEILGVGSLRAYSSGGNDVAFLYDSPGDDLLVVNDTYGSLTGGLPGETFSLTANNFRYVHGYSRAGGTDTAELYGTSGRDTVVARPTDVKLMGAGHFGRAWYFDRVIADGGGGDDVALLYNADPQAGYTSVDPAAPDAGTYYWLWGLEDYTVVNEPAQGGTTYFDAVDAVYTAYWD